MKYFKTYESFKGTGFLTDPAEIEAWLNKMRIINYTVGKDGIVDVNEDVIDISEKKLKKIPVQFGKVSGSFYCSRNQLMSLKGAPKEVGGSFWCDHNQLTSLEGAPETVGGSFGCTNATLTNLKDAPKEVGKDFWCYGNQLINLVGMPKVKGQVHFNNNSGVPTKILDEVYKIMKKNKTDWDTEIKKYIQGDPTVIKYLPKEELKRLSLDKESKLKSSGLI